MVQRIFWIDCGDPGRLAIVLRPTAERLPEEVEAWREAGVTMVASLLEREEARELGLRDETDLCARQGIEFTSFPIPDRGIPEALASAIAVVRKLAQAVQSGGTVGVHCRACIGRSGMIAAAVLMALGQAEDRALAAVSAARGLSVPETPEQRSWVSLVAREFA